MGATFELIGCGYTSSAAASREWKSVGLTMAGRDQPTIRSFRGVGAQGGLRSRPAGFRRGARLQMRRDVSAIAGFAAEGAIAYPRRVADVAQALAETGLGTSLRGWLVIASKAALSCMGPMGVGPVGGIDQESFRRGRPPATTSSGKVSAISAAVRLATRIRMAGPLRKATAAAGGRRRASPLHLCDGIVVS